MVVITGALALTHTKWAHKLDFPQPDWPVADFPLLKYPLDQFTRENEQEEQKCLDMVCLHDLTLLFSSRWHLHLWGRPPCFPVWS